MRKHFWQETLGFVIIVLCLRGIGANQDANRLFEDLLSDYNKLVRPVDNNSETLNVTFKLKLSQLLQIHEKNQIMTTNVWLEHSWVDYKLTWKPDEYGGVDVLYVPSEMIWLPDIVLYNNADGNYQVTIMTKAKLQANGTVEWTPPAIYKSMCQIDVKWFPFDQQKCEMKFGSWTYGGLEVDLQHRDRSKIRTDQVPSYPGGKELETIWIVDKGIDLDEYYPSVEWDILSVPAFRHEKRYPCCNSPFIDITYELQLRRKTLFYTVNLIFPSVGMSFLTALVFYLPSDSGEKISLCISILISLTVFFLLLVEIIPSTSLVIPLIGKYLLFTMVLVTVSVVVTVVTLNVHYRSPTTHTMPKWLRVIFLYWLPRLLQMQRPGDEERESRFKQQEKHKSKDRRKSMAQDRFKPYTSFGKETSDFLSPDYKPYGQRKEKSTPVKSAVDSVCYIADHLRNAEADDEVIEDWKYAAMVMDRLFLWVFTLSCAAGTFAIILRAPTIYDNTKALA